MSRTIYSALHIYECVYVALAHWIVVDINKAWPIDTIEQETIKVTNLFLGLFVCARAMCTDDRTEPIRIM